MAKGLPKQGHMTLRRAFTLIELLIVVVIIGILAVIAIPTYASVKSHAYTARLKSDLHNLAVAQESYFADHKEYAGSVPLLMPAFEPSAGSQISIVEASGAGWSATITSELSGKTCAYYSGVDAVAPATREGEVTCQ
jgi:prepilin-type N-terminal cleavage/methylation domain-containing protein